MTETPPDLIAVIDLNDAGAVPHHLVRIRGAGLVIPPELTKWEPLSDPVYIQPCWAVLLPGFALRIWEASVGRWGSVLYQAGRRQSIWAFAAADADHAKRHALSLARAELRRQIDAGGPWVVTP